LEAVLDEASGHAGVTSSVVTFAGDAREILRAIDVSDAVVFGMPVYRGSVPGSLKSLLDLASLGAKPVAVVATGAAEHDAIAVDDLTAILRGPCGAYVVPPGVYASADDFDGESLCSARTRRSAVLTGSALVDLQWSIAASQSHSESEPLL